MSNSRKKLKEKLENKLFGPGLGQMDENGGFEREIIEGRMSLYYMTGLLYPPESEKGIEEIQDGRDADDNDEHLMEDPDDPLNFASELMPSSLGFTFCVQPSQEISIKVSAARYYEIGKEIEPKGVVTHSSILNEGNIKISTGSESEITEKNKKEIEQWRREPYKADDILINSSDEKFENKLCLSGAAQIEILSRKLNDNSRLITVSLVNKLGAVEKNNRKERTTNTLFQVKLSASIMGKGSFVRYPELLEYIPSDQEESELQLIYGGEDPLLWDMVFLLTGLLNLVTAKK